MQAFAAAAAAAALLLVRRHRLQGSRRRPRPAPPETGGTTRPSFGAARFRFLHAADRNAVAGDVGGAGTDGGGAPVTIDVVPTTDAFRGLARACARGADGCDDNAEHIALAVDIGSAYGHTTNALARALGDPSRTLGIDVGWKFVQASRQRFPHLRFERLDVLEDQNHVAQLVASQLARNGPGALWVFVDIGGVRELAALVRLLPYVVETLGAARVVVKSKRLAAVASARQQQGNADDTSFWAAVVAQEAREGIRGRSRERPGGAPVDCYPLKLPVRYSVDGVEICRFHNYSAAGCIRGSQGRCDLDHLHCHWCGAPGHTALACERTAEDVAGSGGGGGSDGTSPFGTDGRLAPPLKEPAPFLFCLGGRLRGRTLVNCERLRLVPPAQAWELAPGLAEHRGSHGAAVLNGELHVAGGGGMRANLSSCCVLEAGKGGARAYWREAPGMNDPRHAFALVAMGESLYAVGGWTHGSRCVASVERLDVGAKSWRFCAPLLTPRRLHGAAAWPPAICSAASPHQQKQQPRKLYVFGGAYGNGTQDKLKTASVECYDPERNVWEPRTDMPRPMQCAAVACGAYIYVVPGGDDPLLRYDPAADAFEELGPLPLRNWHCCALARCPLSGEDGGAFFAVGGTCGARGAWTGRTFRYDCRRGAWDELPSLKTPRRRTAVAVAWSR